MKFYGNQEDDLPLDQTKEERIQEAQTKMGSRTAFFYGKSSDSFHTSPLADIYISTGTLMAKEVLFNVIFGTSTVSRYNIQTVTQTPAILHDHKRSRVKYCDYPGVIPQEGHSVRGTYVTGLTDGDIYRLDMFEGSQYELQTVRVRLLKSEGDEATGKGNVEGEEVETQTYIWTSNHESLEDKEWDYATFRKEKLARWSGGEPEGQCLLQ
jgi:gamma-glutamylcyclotransferase (GGCT)/AIG2-like uncharacterized protein YtfP